MRHDLQQLPGRVQQLACVAGARASDNGWVFLEERDPNYPWNPEQVPVVVLCGHLQVYQSVRVQGPQRILLLVRLWPGNYNPFAVSVVSEDCSGQRNRLWTQERHWQGGVTKGLEQRVYIDTGQEALQTSEVLPFHRAGQIQVLLGHSHRAGHWEVRLRRVHFPE